MEEFNSGYIEIARDLILSALLIGVIAMLSTVSYLSFADKSQQEAVKKEVVSYRKVFPYDDKVVTGVDVLTATQRFKRMYNFEVLIKTGTNDYVSILELSPDDPAEEWTIDKITSALGDYISHNFKVNLVNYQYDSYDKYTTEQLNNLNIYNIGTDIKSIKTFVFKLE